MSISDVQGSSSSGLERDKDLTSTRRDLARAWAIVITWLTDNAVLVAACYTATFLRFGNLSDGNTPRLLIAVLPAFFLAGLTLSCYDVQLLRHPFRSARKAVFAGSIAFSVLFAIAFALQVGALFSRLETGIMIVAAAIYLCVGRIMLATFFIQHATTIDTIVVVFGRIRNRSSFGNSNIIAPQASPDPGDPSALERIYLQVKHADRVLLAFDDPTERAAWIKFVRLIGVDAEVIEPDLQKTQPIGLGTWEGVATLLVARGPMRLHERVVKRAGDLALSLVSLVLLSPLLLILIVLIKLETPGPAIFIQPRVGRNNRRYDCYKLRTMYCDRNDVNGDCSTARDDGRVTALGKFLRRASLDELPQLWNVIKGEMSMVGPRPHALGSMAQGTPFWEVEPGYWTRHAIKPGITGLAQIRGLRGGNISKLDLQERVAADLEYINSWSIWLDLKILIKTIGAMVHRNAY